MLSLVAFVLIYLCGGLTFLPVVLLIVYLKSPRARTQSMLHPKEPYEMMDENHGKKGWIGLSHEPPLQANDSRGKSKLWPNGNHRAKRDKSTVYGVLKHGTLFVYESEKLLECKMIIPVHDYSISMYPKDRRDHELFHRRSAVRFRPKNWRGRNATILNADVSPSENNLRRSKTDSALDANIPWSAERDLYLTCNRPIDKEDWYHALLAASAFMADPTDRPELVNGARFDATAIESLITSVQHHPEGRQTQWLNAIAGRLFLGLYKTEKVQQLVKKKIIQKAKKMRRPNFLDEILVKSVHIGHAIPLVTDPKLVSLAVDGSLEAEAHVSYAGGLCVVIETDLHWSYSSRMKPIRVHLVLSVTLKRLTGKLVVKIKPPPTNRVWWAFESPPELDLVIKPIVSDKQIKLSMVTNAIESKIREVIAETIVLPNMEDVPFSDSCGLGGIFSEGFSPNSKGDTDDSSVTVPPSMETCQTEPLAPLVKESPTFDVSLQHTESDKRSDKSSLLENGASLKPSPEFAELRLPETFSVASVESTDSSTGSSTSSMPRWSTIGLRRKRVTKSVDGISVNSEQLTVSETSQETIDEASALGTRGSTSGRRSLLSKFSTLKSERSEEMRLANSEKKGGLYQKAGTLWQKGKEMAARELERKRASVTNDSPTVGTRLGDTRRRYSESQSTLSLDAPRIHVAVSRSENMDSRPRSDAEDIDAEITQRSRRPVSCIGHIPVSKVDKESIVIPRIRLEIALDNRPKTAPASIPQETHSSPFPSESSPLASSPVTPFPAASLSTPAETRYAPSNPSNSTQMTESIASDESDASFRSDTPEPVGASQPSIASHDSMLSTPQTASPPPMPPRRQAGRPPLPPRPSTPPKPNGLHVESDKIAST